ncbi:MAG: hypothetical protein F4Z82_14220 [Caldilineaceae bacterium SB0668_bin_21]|nr:hypothetical protein [Caldilineaceae bacterium SB0668_bin_21]MYC22256.1 hypothetical protein [Caldilineaceae bacterium SB0662_bin_25]
MTELPRHRALLQALVPRLAALEQTKVIWLKGSLARGDADRWSSVDLHLLWDQNGSTMAAPSRPYHNCLDAIQETLEEEIVFVEQKSDSARGGSLRGITAGTPSGDDALDHTGAAAVLFELSWTLLARHEGIKSPGGAARLLYVAKHMDSASKSSLTGKQQANWTPDSRLIESQLGRFWLLLARLPAVVRRREQLAAYLLLTEMQALLLDLVVTLNGGSRPHTNSRINQFLGPAQREAFERSMGLQPSGRQKSVGDCATWVGQAVALVVLYRWYAPQLAQKHSLRYPHMAEDAVLALLSTELQNWPASISTG